MKEEKWDVYCTQETWKLGDFELEIDGYTIIHHNAETKESGNMNPDCRVQRGVALFLSPEFSNAYKLAGAPPPPTTSPQTGNFSGRFIGIPLTFDNYDDYGKK